MTQPLVSVKMLAYNHAPFVARAIEGVLGQRTRYPFELVIGEDRSTDGTREIVLSYQRRHPAVIRVITSEQNVGMKQNAMRTLQACRGKYVAYCEGDDHWHHPEKLEKQALWLEQHHACGLVYSSYDVYHPASGKRITDFIAHRKWDEPDQAGISEIVDGTSRPLTCTVMVRRAIVDRVIKADAYLHQSGHFLMGDTQLWAEVAAESRLQFLPESLATHIITEESATRSRDLGKELRFALSGAEVLLYLSRKHNLPRRVRERHEACVRAAALRLAFHLRDGGLAESARAGVLELALRERLLYYGTRNMLLHYPLRLAIALRGLFRKRHDQWH